MTIPGRPVRKVWAAGRHKWLALSCHSKPTTAPDSGHYIYVDRPGIAIQRVTAQATR